MRPDNPRHVLIVLLPAAAVVLALLGSPLRGVLAPLVLLAPGLLLTAVAFPPGTLGPAARLVAVLGFSLSTIALLGLVLNELPWGLQPATWLGGLAAISLVLVLVARGSGRPLRMPRPRWTGGRPQMVAWLAVFVAGIATAAVLVANHADATVQRGGDFTQLWLVPGASGGASLGVASDESTTIRYDLDLVVDSRTLRRWLGLSLRPGQTWQTAIPLATLRGVQGRIEARLYRADRPGAIYRYVTLWVGNGQGQAGLAAGAGPATSPGGGQSPPSAAPVLQVAVQPAAVPLGGTERLDIVSRPSTLIQGIVDYPGSPSTSFFDLTDTRGRLVLTVPVPEALPVGDSLRIVVRAMLPGAPVQVVRSVRLLPPAHIPLAAALSVELPMAGLQRGEQAPLLVHYSPHVPVRVTISFPDAPAISLSGETNSSGVLALTIAVPAHAAGQDSNAAALLTVRALDVRGPAEVTRTIPIEQGINGP